MRRLVPALLLVVAACAGAGVEAEIEVVEVAGYVDDATLAYLRDSIRAAAEAERELLIVQFDAAAVVAAREELEATVDLMRQPPLPLVSWLGPAPARASGGVAELLAAAPLVTLAPGSEHDADPDLVSPSLRQLVQDLDGMTIAGFEPLRTLTTDLPDRQVGVTTKAVTFTQPGLWHRFLHLGASPEGAFFFLAMGLTLAAFEFFALGPGLAAGVAAVALFLGSHGIAVLPVNGWAVAGCAAAIWLLSASYQRGGVLAINAAATLLLVGSGLAFSTNPEVRLGVPGLILSVVAVLFFFLLALPAVGRARLSTRTIGRHGLLGRTGRAAVDFGPDGVVLIDGARWPATAHREAAIREGDQVVVTALLGREVEVERLAAGTEREN